MIRTVLACGLVFAMNFAIAIVAIAVAPDMRVTACLTAALVTAFSVWSVLHMAELERSRAVYTPPALPDRTPHPWHSDVHVGSYTDGTPAYLDPAPPGTRWCRSCGEQARPRGAAFRFPSNHQFGLMLREFIYCPQPSPTRRWCSDCGAQYTANTAVSGARIWVPPPGHETVDNVPTFCPNIPAGDY